MNNENKMSVTEFADKYKKYVADSKNDELNKLMSKVIKRRYAPVALKKSFLQIALNSSIQTKSNGYKYIDMFALRINFYSMLVPLYTTLYVEKDENDTPLVLEAYDAMHKNDIHNTDIWDEIFNEELVPGEFDELMSIQKNLIDTFYNKEGNTGAIIMKLIDDISRKLGIAAGYAINEMEKMTGDKNVSGKIIDGIKKFTGEK